jgi:hypothetical protein
MDFDGDVDGIDFLGFDYLMRHLVHPDEGDQDGDAWSAPRGWGPFLSVMTLGQVS